MNIREGGKSKREILAEKQGKKLLTEEKKVVQRKKTMEKDEEEEEEARRVAQVTNITKKHYRTFFDDELENNKQIFKRMPFYSFDVMRGQSRGAKKGGWFSFGADQVDESGQASTLTKCGYFKGSIDITNLDDHRKFLEEKEASINKIIALLNQISQKVNDPFDF